MPLEYAQSGSNFRAERCRKRIVGFDICALIDEKFHDRGVPYQALCDLFDRETKNGAKMEKHSDLLVKAINAIVRTFQKRTASGLQSGRDFVIPDKQEQATDASDFELITWLVIKSGKN